MQTLSLASPLFHPRQRSLARGNLLVAASLVAAILLSHFPHVQANPWLVLPAVGVLLGTADTTRCMRKQWSFYHGGVLLCIYMDLMATTLVLFALIYPYIVSFTGVHS